MSATDHPGWVCDGCGKHVSGSIPRDQCADCGGRWFVATDDRLSCDRCGGEDASSVLNCEEFDRLCPDCVDWTNRENPECPECGRRMIAGSPGRWECPDCWHQEADSDV